MAVRITLRSLYLRGVQKHVSLSTQRAMSQADYSQHQQPQMDMDTAYAFVELNNQLLSHPKMAYTRSFEAIRTELALQPLSERWQAAVQAVMTSQVNTMVHIGFTPDQAGLESFTKQLHGLRNADSSRRLSASIQKSWATVLSAAFGVEMQDEELLSVEQARELTSTLAQRMQSEDFNKQIDTAMAGLGNDTDKQRALIALLTPIQLEVASKFGLEGEAGYLKMQMALILHADDDSIKYNTMAGTFAMLRRAGIQLQ